VGILPQTIMNRGIPRITAALLTIVLIGFISLAIIVLITWIGPAQDHGEMAEHLNGKVSDVRVLNNAYVFDLTSGCKKETFVCSQRCLKQIQHIKRHVAENASTDVYYVESPVSTMPIAIDVD
jgi:hypothetical protein